MDISVYSLQRKHTPEGQVPLYFAVFWFTSREDAPSGGMTNGWLPGSEKAVLHRNGVGLQICKAKTGSRLCECGQCDCSVTCLGLLLLLLVSTNGSQSEGN